MRQTNRRVRGVDALCPPGPDEQKVSTRTSPSFQLHFHFVGFRKHRHRNRRSVSASLLLRLRHALHAVHAAFVLQLVL